MFGVSCVHDKALVDVEFHQPLGLPSPKCVKQCTNPNPDLNPNAIPNPNANPPN